MTHMADLAAASARVRGTIAQGKRELHEAPTREAASKRLRLLLLCGPNDIESARVMPLLAACTGVGEKCLEFLCDELRVSNTLHVRDLSIPRREDLAAAVAAHGGRGRNGCEVAA